MSEDIFIIGIILFWVAVFFIDEINKRKLMSPRGKWDILRHKIIKSRKRCESCGGIDILQLHHINPVGLGGGNESENLILLCKNCHEKSHNASFRHNSRIIDQSYGEIGFIKEKKILSAIKFGNTIEITYTNIYGLTRKRKIIPKEIYKEKGNKYIKAYCYFRNEDRVFRLSRLQIDDNVKSS